MFFALGTIAHTKTISTNAVNINHAPDWLKRTRVEKSINRIQTRLEWSTRRVNAYFYKTASEFEKIHSFGPLALAVTKISNGVASIHLGPKLNTNNFDQSFSHEMVHVILFQKYKGAIPKWLEEGLANHLAQKDPVNYQWLAQAMKQKNNTSDIYSLSHPFDEKGLRRNNEGIKFRYLASQAFAEMLDKKCDLQNLIRLSVKRKMEDYIKTYCGLKDINKSFKNWVTEKSKVKN